MQRVFFRATPPNTWYRPAGAQLTLQPALCNRSASGFVRRLTGWSWLVFLASMILADGAAAQPYLTPPSWGGDILSRPRLTGDWDGLRDDLAQHGIVFDLDVLLTPQGNLSGGRNTGGDLWGNADYTLNIDTQKLGLWSGGYFKFEADTGFGSNIFNDVGAILPVNTAALVPAPDERTTVLTNATYTQFFSPQFAVYGGKINTLDSAATEFYGDYRTQFLNIGTSFPMTLEQVPISTFGGGVIAIPQEDIMLTGSVFGPSGTPDSNDPKGKAFDGVLLCRRGDGNGQAVRAFGPSIRGIRLERQEAVFAGPRYRQSHSLSAAAAVSAPRQSRAGA